MARRHEAEQLLMRGLCPKEIADEMKISVTTVLQYLCTRAGEGSLMLSDLYFSWNSEQRRILQKQSRRKWPGLRELEEHGLTVDEVKLFASLQRRNVLRGDMYQYVVEAEVAMHNLVRWLLVQEYGDGESGWWKKGIPEEIRVDCQGRRERDEIASGSEPFDYTTLIELWKILDKNWRSWEAMLSRVSELRAKLTKDAMKKNLTFLNRIRNVVMHPVRQKEWTEDDLEFVRHLSIVFNALYGHLTDDHEAVARAIARLRTSRSS